MPKIFAFFVRIMLLSMLSSKTIDRIGRVDSSGEDLASMKDLLLQRWTLSCWTSDDARNAICTTLASAGIGFLIVTKDPDYAVMLRVSAI